MRNIRVMGHPGNWSERKVGDVRSQNARADREALKTATFEEHGEKGWKLAEMHPCYAHRMRWTVRATCMGCLDKRWVDIARLQHGSLAHAPWPRVMASLTCTRCGSCAGALHFERTDGVRRIELGSLIARPADLNGKSPPTR